jgi:hypothetical protein
MWPYLVNSAQTQLINTISIYTEKGDTPESARVLYLNATALKVWNSMERRQRRSVRFIDRLSLRN